MKKPELKIVTPKIKQRTFSNSCPKKFKFLPEKECVFGKPVVNDKGKVIQSGSCEWWINSEAHNYCFWTYIHAKSDENGVMDELSNTELSRLMGFSGAKAHVFIKAAFEELLIALNKINGKEMLRELHEEHIHYKNNGSD